MICLHCEKEFDHKGTGVIICPACSEDLRQKSENEPISLTEETVKDAQEMLGQLTLLCAGKHPNVTLNALGTMVGVIIGQIDHPEYREQVWRNFKMLVSEKKNSYTSKAIKALFDARQAADKLRAENEAKEQAENPPSNLD